MAKSKPQTPDGISNIAENRKARYNYTISNVVECGIVLVGSEVKSLRAHKVNFADAHAIIKNDEVLLIGFQIEQFPMATHENHEPNRTRKLLLHKKEINKFSKLTSERGVTLVPLKIYFKKNLVKILIGVGKGKKTVDKRETIKARQANKEASRALKRG